VLTKFSECIGRASCEFLGKSKAAGVSLFFMSRERLWRVVLGLAGGDEALGGELFRPPSSSYYITDYMRSTTTHIVPCPNDHYL